MKFKLEVDCDNAAFQDMAAELRNIMQGVAKGIELVLHTPNKWNTIQDTNGNTVGRFKLAEDQYWNGEGE